MAVSKKKLQNFFSKQKVGDFSALNGTLVKKSVSNPLADDTQSVSNPLADDTQSVSNPLADDTQSVSNPLADDTQSVSNPLADDTQSVSNPLADDTQSVSNPLADDTQSVSNPLADDTQSVSNPLADDTQSVSNPLADDTQSVSNPLADDTQSVSNPLADDTQSVSNPLADDTQSVSNLDVFTDKELSLLCIISDHLSSPNSASTNEIKTSFILANMSISAIRLRNLIFRIKKKNGLEVEKNKSSRTAFRIFKFNKNILKLLKKYKKDTYNNSNNNYITNITIEEDEQKNHSKNTNNNYLKENNIDFSNLTSHQSESTTLSTAEPESKNKKLTYNQLPEEWQSINYHFLDDLHFKQYHVIELYKLDVLEPEVVQESIEHFAYGIKHNPDSYKKYKDPLKVFYGSLRKGKPWTESTYKSTKEIATEDLIQRRKAEKRKIAEETCKLVEEMERESYERWYYSLSEEEKKEIKEKHQLQESGIFNIFDEKIYKLHYGKNVMEEYKDPTEIAIEQFIAKKKRKEEEEAKRIKKMLQECGVMKEYYKWAGELKESEIKKITEEDGGMTERGQNKMIIYYAKNLIEKV